MERTITKFKLGGAERKEDAEMVGEVRFAVDEITKIRWL